MPPPLCGFDIRDFFRLNSRAEGIELKALFKVKIKKIACLI